MTADVTTTNRCNRLLELPAIFAEWQQKAYRPDCDHYCDGQCSRRAGEGACPFDGVVLPLRELTVEAPDEESNDVFEPLSVPESPPPLGALEQSIRSRIADRTGRRVRALVTELTERELIVRGTVSCYYLKQLALHAALDALGSAREMGVALRFEVGVVPTDQRFYWQGSDQ